jgi:LuxR family transcriptional regulator, maltose regulon positive regulatory protein
LIAYLRSPSQAHRAYVQQLLAIGEGTKQATRPGTQPAELVEPLTSRELEILHGLAAGLSNRQIADKLILAEGTVKFYVHNVLEKLGVHSRTQALAEARRHNLL